MAHSTAPAVNAMLIAPLPAVTVEDGSAAMNSPPGCWKMSKFVSIGEGTRGQGRSRSAILFLVPSETQYRRDGLGALQTCSGTYLRPTGQLLPFRSLRRFMHPLRSDILRWPSGWHTSRVAVWFPFRA